MDCIQIHLQDKKLVTICDNYLVVLTTSMQLRENQEGEQVILSLKIIKVVITFTRIMRERNTVHNEHFVRNVLTIPQSHRIIAQNIYAYLKNSYYFNKIKMFKENLRFDINRKISQQFNLKM